MQRPGGSPRRATAALVVAVLVIAGCGGGSDEAGPDDVATSEAVDATATSAPEGSAAASTSTTDEATTSGTVPPTTALPDASEAQRSAPGDGTGTALLSSVRVGRNDGFERIVFEFEGTAMPGYRIQWVDGPITADGSGEPVDVTGEAHLEMVLEPASGVDLSSPELRITYDGPDRVPTTGSTQLLTDLVRTGDFEAVLTWVAGAGERRPFRVLTLTSPTRVVVDLAT
jgi:hypothetical protein